MKDDNSSHRFHQRFRGIVYQGDLNRSATFLHGSFAELTGYEEEELLNGRVKWSQLIHPDDRPMPGASEFVSCSNYFGMREFRIVCKDGEVRWVLEIIQNVCDEQGRSLFVQGVIHDITERRQVVEALRESEARYRCIVETASEGIWGIDADLRTIFLNRIMTEMLGYDAAEVVGRPPCDFLFEEDLKDYREHLTFLREDLKDRFECRLRRKDGTPLWTIVSVTGLTDEANRFAGGFGMFLDITDRKRWEEALREAEFKYRMVAENTHDWEFWIGRDGKFIYTSPSCERITGYSAEDFQKDPGLFVQLIHPSDRERFLTFQGSEERCQGPGSIQFRLRHADGNERWIEHLCHPVWDENRRLLGIRGSNRDITKRTQAEEALRSHRDNLEKLVEEGTRELRRTNEMLRREILERKLIRDALQATDEQLAAIIEFLPDATFVIDRQKRVIAWNRAIEEMTGVRKEQILGKGEYAYSAPFYGSPGPMLIDLLMGGGPDVAERYDAVTSKGNTVFGEEQVTMTCDGREACLWVTASLLFDRRGNLLGAIQSIRDITERSHARDALVSSEKQLRELSSRLLRAQEEERKRIAQELHDSIGQSLAALKFNVESVHFNLGRGEKSLALQSLGGLVPRIQQAIEEARRIYMGLRPSMLDDLGIIATIRWCCREFQRTYPETRIETQIGISEEEVPDDLKIVVYRIIQEALNNISKHSRAREASVILAAGPAMLDLSIRDNGVGFELQTSAVNDDSARGMGVKGMRERTELSGGSFTLISAPGKGTTVLASWPLPT